MGERAADRAAIAAVIQDWALWRDSGDFDRLLTCWYPGGQMATTWQRSDAAAFVAASRAAFACGLDVVHKLGGTTVDLAGKRAVAQTRMTIAQRAELDGVLVDVSCVGRFYDLFERREGRWAMLLRQPIYERDRLDPVPPGAVVSLDPALLDSFPAGYRHLGYLQTRLGMTVARDLPGRSGPALDALYALGRRWLAGEPVL